jgi:hypothetical protein
VSGGPGEGPGTGSGRWLATARAAGGCPGPPQPSPLSRKAATVTRSGVVCPVAVEDRARTEFLGLLGGRSKTRFVCGGVRGPRCGLVAPCGSGQPAAMRFAPFAASRPRGYRVDGAIVLVLCGPAAHRPACGGRDPMRKTADLAYNGRNSPARRELKLFRDVYGVAPILRNGRILRATGTGGAGGRKRSLMARQPAQSPGMWHTSPGR